jgi:hypothetical protein
MMSRGGHYGMTPSAAIDAIADSFAAMFTAGDVKRPDGSFASNFQISYNVSDATLGRDEALSFFGSYFTSIKDGFRDVRQLVTASSWGQQHRVDVNGPDALRIIGVPAVLIFTLDGDRIARIEEYFDSTQTLGWDARQRSPNSATSPLGPPTVKFGGLHAEICQQSCASNWWSRSDWRSDSPADGVRGRAGRNRRSKCRSGSLSL